jgi:hypothetical protein
MNSMIPTPETMDCQKIINRGDWEIIKALENLKKHMKRCQCPSRQKRGKGGSGLYGTIIYKIIFKTLLY